MVTAVRMVEFGTVARIVRSTRGDAALLLATAARPSPSTSSSPSAWASRSRRCSRCGPSPTAPPSSASRCRRPTSTPRLEHALLHEHIVAYRLDGALFFGAAQRFLLELTEVSDVEVVILRLGRLRVIDSTGAQALADLITHLEHRGITVLLSSVRPEHRRLIERVGVLDRLAHENHLLPTIDEALIHARRHVHRRQAAAVA